MQVYMDATPQLRLICGVSEPVASGSVHPFQLPSLQAKKRLNDN